MAPLKVRLAIGGSRCPTTIDQIAAVKHMGVRPRTLNSRTLRYDAPAPLSEGIQEALSGLGEPGSPAIIGSRRAHTSRSSGLAPRCWMAIRETQNRIRRSRT